VQRVLGERPVLQTSADRICQISKSCSQYRESKYCKRTGRDNHGGIYEPKGVADGPVLCSAPSSSIKVQAKGTEKVPLCCGNGLREEATSGPRMALDGEGPKQDLEKAQNGSHRLETTKNESGQLMGDVEA
jgi:hypothetical protein